MQLSVIEQECLAVIQACLEMMLRRRSMTKREYVALLAGLRDAYAHLEQKRLGTCPTGRHVNTQRSTCTCPPDGLQKGLSWYWRKHLARKDVKPPKE